MTHIQREDGIQKQAEDSHLEAKQKGLKQTRPSQVSEGTNPADTLISNF